jgi:hypothetical protein
MKGGRSWLRSSTASKGAAAPDRAMSGKAELQRVALWVRKIDCDASGGQIEERTVSSDFVRVRGVGGIRRLPPLPTQCTVTVADPQSVAPVELVATTLYVVVAPGCTVIEPLSGTGAPFSVALTAFRVVQVITDD